MSLSFPFLRMAELSPPNLQQELPQSKLERFVWMQPRAT